MAEFKASSLVRRHSDGAVGVLVGYNTEEARWLVHWRPPHSSWTAEYEADLDAVDDTATSGSEIAAEATTRQAGGNPLPGSERRLEAVTAP